RRGRARARARRLALRPLPLAPGAHLRRQAALRHASQVRRPRRGKVMARETTEDTPARADEGQARPAPPCTMVIFGATGDLTKRKLMPALYNLIAGGLLPEEFAVVGVGRTPLSDTELCQRMEEALRRFATVEVDDEKVDWLTRRLRYVAGEADDGETFKRLAETLAK